MAARRPATATFNAFSSPRYFSNNSSKKFATALYKDEAPFNKSQILDVFDAPTKVTRRTSRPPLQQPSTYISSLPPPITFDGPSRSRPRAYSQHAMNTAPAAGSIVEMFDGPAKPRTARKPPLCKGTANNIAIATGLTVIGTAVAVANACK
ncbi:hypothetical protein ARMGADRAFT_1069667 [Armillaria gallica]|uniref:Uncharacterized protein n=1 Tax=Armillaria gallica TaxID=47427 RepID=A0A2H3ERC8_ARMGA|nr:hypothetical protein ARMGADRAFT_1069667 [Armillaria gallica]